MQEKVEQLFDLSNEIADLISNSIDMCTVIKDSIELRRQQTNNDYSHLETAANILFNKLVILSGKYDEFERFAICSSKYAGPC